MENAMNALKDQPLVLGLWGVRYQVKDVQRSIAFYTQTLGFNLDFQNLPAFGQVSTGGFKLILSGPGASGSRPMPDGREQEPGGWNRVVLQVEDLPARISELKNDGARFRNEMEVGPGGRQIQVEDLYGDRPRQLRRHGSGGASGLGALRATDPALSAAVHRALYVRAALCREVARDATHDWGRMMDTDVRTLFERYEQVFGSGLRGCMDMNEAASLYASDFIAATPAGVVSGKNDERLKQVMAQGYEHYRAIGIKDMRMRGLRISPIDEHHCVAHVAWTATYARKHQPDVAIDFEVHYFVQDLNSEPRVFGWVSGDEQAALKEHGVI
jgi:predicted enzyme related to lactoylglutathione lyase